MTVSYNFDATSTTWVGLSKLLFRWRGSVWKAIMFELIWWLLAHFALNYALNTWLNDVQLKNFEDVRAQVQEQMKDYPIVFMLGFFMTVIFNRWVSIFQYIGFIDTLALSVSIGIRGKNDDTETRLLRRNIIRYTVLSQALVFRDISLQCRKRFPDTDSLIDCAEHDIYALRQLPVPKYWIPIQWALQLTVKARNQGMISADLIMTKLQDNIRDFRTSLERLCCYDWVPVPMAYPQIVYIAVRGYFLIQLIISQTVPRVSSLNGNRLRFPFIPLLQFVLFAGWAKVAEQLINPFGTDDDDYDCSYVIDRNLTTGFAIVDTVQQPPDNELDPFWTLAVPRPLDTPMESASTSEPAHQPYVGSVADVDMSKTTHDPHYQLNRVRRRSMLQRMTSTSMIAAGGSPQTVRKDTTIAELGLRYGRRPSRNSISAVDMSRHRPLEDLCETLEEESERTDDESTPSAPNP